MIPPRTSDARPYGCGVLCALSFRNWECVEYLRRIYSGYRNNDKHHPNANWPSAKTERCSPLRVRDFLYNVAVGAAIGRPVSMAEFSLHPRSKQHYNIAGTAQCAAPAMLIIFSMLIYGVRLATSSGSPPPAGEPPSPQGEGKGQNRFPSGRFFCAQCFS